MTPLRYRQRAHQTVVAIEWTGDNLQDVQALMAPASPLDHGPNREQLGINVHNPVPEYGLPTKLVFVPKGGIITRDAAGRLRAFATRELFEEEYELDIDESADAELPW